MEDIEHYPVGESIIPTLHRYIQHRLEPGGFLRAVLENDLRTAIWRADYQNSRNIPNIVKVVELICPRESWGNKQNVENWLKK